MAKSVGLRTEILITLTLLLGAALLLGGFMMLHLNERSLVEERIRHLDSLVYILSQSLTVQDTDRSLLDQLPDKLNCSGWWFYDRELNIIGSYTTGQPPHFPASVRQLVKITTEPQQEIVFPPLLNLFSRSRSAAYFMVPVMEKNRLAGLLEFNFSLDDIRLNLFKLQKIVLLYILLYGTILVLAGYYLLQRNIIRPAQNLFKATEEVSRGNLETRLPSAGPTEFSQLSVAYNRMVEALQVSHGETEKHILSLEETNRKLQQTRDELIRSEKMASVGQLAAGLAHELGNPLSALIGYLELLKQKIESTPDKNIIERSLIETNRIDFLVRELLDFSRPAENVQIESVNMAIALNSSVQLLINQGAMTDLIKINKLPETLPLIKIDRHKLQQVFINLLLNATQACDQQGEIVLSAGNNMDSVWVGIRDDGSGIAAADLNKIFDPFFTTKPPGEGTGLGLAMCQRIVEEAGGTIDVDSVPGGGSFFKLVFYAKGRPDTG